MPLLAERITRQRPPLRRRRGAARPGRRRRRVLTWRSTARSSTPAAIVGLLADDDRRRVVAALELGATGLDDVAAATGLPPDRASRALGRLVDGRARGQPATTGRLAVARRRVPAGRPRRARATAAASEHADEPDERRKVLDAFVRDGRITSIPAARAQAAGPARLAGPGLRARAALHRARGQRRSSAGATPTRRRCAGTSSTRACSTAAAASTGAAAARSSDVTVERGALRRRSGVAHSDARRAGRDPRRLPARWPVATTPTAARPTTAAMAAINEAYRVLGEPARRAVYDAARAGPARRR